MPGSQRATAWVLLAVAAAVIAFEASPRASLPPVPSNTWAQASALSKARSGAASAVLQDGRILITGGESSGAALTSTEIYDATDGTFKTAASMKRARFGHAAAVLRDGRVLVVGGDAAAPAQTAEIYDPSTNSWSLTGGLVDSRIDATATLLNDGRVLIAGGADNNGGVLASLEIFDPATNAFTYAGSIVPGRTGHSASLLRDGRVLIVGGSDGQAVFNSAEIFDPDSLSTSPAPALSAARAGHTATTLLDGTVLIIGGHDDAGDLASAEIFDPKAGLFSPVESTLITPRRDHAAFALPHNGGVLIVGGTSGGAALDSAELYMPWTKTFHPAASMAESRMAVAGGAAGRDGLLLVAGGRNASGSLASAELYGFATVKTDKGDFAPGEAVKISGSGWQPGEQVTLVLHEDLATPIHDDDVLTATADLNGDIVNKEFAPDDHDLGLTFYLTATGTASQAQTTFTDEPINGPALNIVKNASVPGGTADVVGELVSYYITVANIGNQVLTGVAVTDPFVSNLTRIADVKGNNDNMLDVGETWAYTASHAVTQPDIDTNGGGDGLIDNTATADSDQTDPDHDDASVLVQRRRTLSLSKTAEEMTYSNAGDALHYDYVVTNTGNTTFAGPVTVTDDKAATVTCPAGGLSPGASMMCTATYTVITADVTAGSVTNHANAHSNGINSPQAMATVPLAQIRTISLVKTVFSGSPYNAVGNTLTYHYVVTNTGNARLAQPVTVTDDKAAVTCPAVTTVGNLDMWLDPGEAVTCTATYSIVQADLNNGSVTNHATAHADGANSPQESATATATQTPAVSLKKTVTETSYAAVNDPLTYSYEVKNTGNVRLAGPVTVGDDKVTVTCPALTTVGNNDTFLDPNEVVTCSATYHVTQGDLNSGSVINHATAHVGGTDSNQDSQTVNANQIKTVSLKKSVTETSYSAVNDPLTYSYEVKNTGNVRLAGPVTVGDDKVAVVCPALTTIGNNDTFLDPNEVVTCGATYHVTQGDLNNGSVTNHATAHVAGTDSNPDQKTVNANQIKTLSMKKSVTETSYSAVNDPLTYSYEVKNTGNVRLAGPVTVGDDRVAVICPALTTVGNNDTFLDPNEVVTCGATYHVTQGDLNAGSVTNHATGHAGGTDSNEDEKTVTANQIKTVSLKKSVTETSYAAVGDPLTYSYEVKNTGNVRLAGPVTVTDDKATVTCPALTTIGNNDTFLDPNEVVTCSAIYHVTQGDLNAGSVTNRATAHVAGTDSNPDEKTVTANQIKTVSLKKSVTETSYSAVNDPLTYSYEVKNTGNVRLAGPVTVTDDKATVTCPALTTVGNNDTFLDPNEVVTCSATYHVTLGDLNAGSVTNHATAHVAGTDSNPDQQTVTANQIKALTLVKSATESSYDTPDQALDYSYLVTNTGNVSLLGPVTVSDDRATPVTCPAVTTVGNNDGYLDPTEAVTCHGSYTVTQADIDAGSVTNHATAYAADTHSPEAMKTVPATQHKILTVAKNASVDGGTANVAGEIVNYTITIINGGNVTFHTVVVSDPFVSDLTRVNPDPVGNNDAILDVGETWAYTATHTVTQNDIDTYGGGDGLIDNTVTVTTAEGVSKSDHASVPVIQQPALSLKKSVTETSYSAVNDPLTYSYEVKNTGNVQLAGPVTVTDDKATVTCPALTTIGNHDTWLDPMEVVTCSATYHVTQNDLNGGSVTNHATAHAGGTDSNEDQKTVNANQIKAVSLKKSVTETSYSAVNDPLTYSYEVKNTGNVRLAGPVTVSDDKATVTCPALTIIGNNDTFLDPNEVVTCSATYHVTQGDLNAGSVTNHATAHVAGTDSNPDQKTVNANQIKTVSLKKSVTETSYAAVGDPLTYSYEVKNTGNVRLAGPVTVTDDKATVTCPALTTVGNNDTFLDPNEVVTCGATYHVTQGDLNAGSVTNHATAHVAGTDSNPDQKTVNAAPVPSLSLVKNVLPADAPYDEVGDTLHYTYLVTNNGNVRIMGPVTVTDDKVATVTCPAVATVGNLDAWLDPLEAVTCTGSYNVTQGDLDAGSVTNHATAHVPDVNSPQAMKTVAASQQKILTVAKNATVPGGTANVVGEIVSYTITIINGGNVTFHNIVVTDPFVSNLAQVHPDPVGNDDAILDPGETWAYSATHMVSQDDLNTNGGGDGLIDNTATVTTLEGVSKSDDASVPVQQQPALLLTKSATETGYTTAGQVLHYSYTVTNTGNIRLLGPVSIADDKATPPVCANVNAVGNLDGWLDPGEAVGCAATYTITQPDIVAGSVTNHATANAGGTYSNEAMAVVPLDAAHVPGIIQVVKTTVGGDAMFSFTTSPSLSPGSFNITTVGGNGPAQVFSLVPPGSGYSVAETPLAGWTQTTAICTDGIPSNIVVLPGETVTCTFTNTKNAPAGNLVLDYNFNEGSGGTAHDHSGYGNDGTVSGATWTGSGKNGGALSFDGVDDWVTALNNFASLDLTTGMTLEAWVKSTSNTGWRPVIHKDGTGSEPGLSYAMYGSDFSWPPSGYATTTTGPAEWLHAVGASQLTLNTWTHLAVTYDGASLKLYVNAVLVSTLARTGPMITTSAPLRIGGSPVVPNPVGPQFFKGLIDDVRIYNIALTQGQIATDRLTPVP
jgi:uncharacterized repeat protein (TIGR01451 family)